MKNYKQEWWKRDIESLVTWTRLRSDLSSDTAKALIDDVIAEQRLRMIYLYGAAAMKGL